MEGQRFYNRFMILILSAWIIPPVFGFSFLVSIGMFTGSQVATILVTPLEPAFIALTIMFAFWYFRWYIQPVRLYLQSRSPSADHEIVIRRMQGFTLRFWLIFAVYLLLAPASVIISAETYTDYRALPVDWFRIHMVALTVSIIVGLPIFFLIFDLFGKIIQNLELKRPIVSIRTRIFLIGSLMPLLIDTMLVQYYWTRTGYFTFETFLVWLGLEVLAIIGTLVFLRSFKYSLAPLQNILVGEHSLDEINPDHLTPQSTDELGIIANSHRQRLEENRNNRKEQQRLLTILEATTDLIAITDGDGFISYMNRAGHDLLGIKPDEDLSGTQLQNLMTDEDAKLLLEKGYKIASEDGAWSNETGFVSKDDQIIASSQVLISHKNEAGEVTFYSTIARDIRSAEEAKRQVEYLAYYDSLTDLPNRNELISRLQAEIDQSDLSSQHSALIFIDLDNFKHINDSLGHPVGDQVLQIVARRLETVVRGEDTIARLGGDEFVVMLSGLNEDAGIAAAQAQEISDKISSKLSLPIRVEERSLQVTVSAGIALFSGSAHDAHELLRYADTAMYDAKQSGKNTVRLFHEGMEAHFSRILSLETELREALQQKQFALYYQPKILHQGEDVKIAGAEALIRWQHPDQGLLSPGDFLDVLESSGLVIPVGDWVIKESLVQLSEWLKKGIWNKANRLSINISPRQFRNEDFVPLIMTLIEETGVPASCIDMEITENVVIENIEETIAKMKAIERLGVTFSLDDFGIGYSSLRYLKSLPFSTLKIDQSFIRDIITNPSDKLLVSTMLSMSRHLGLDVVAEGIETRDQLELLESEQCHCFQGYYFSKPLTAAELEKLLVG